MAAFTPPPVAPDRGDRATFSGRVDAFLNWVVKFASEVLGFEANLNTLAAGGANSFAYNFDSNTADADPGPGKIRFSAGNQNAATIVRIDNLTSGGADITSALNAILNVTSSIKGAIRIQKVNDVSRWILFDITAGSDTTGYKNLSVIPRASSMANPFVAGDSLMVFIDRSGDMGNAVTAQDIRNAIGVLPIVNGGTNANTAPQALTNLGALPTAGGNMTGTLVMNNFIPIQWKDGGGTPRNVVVLQNDGTVNHYNAGGGIWRIINGALNKDIFLLEDSGNLTTFGVRKHTTLGANGTPRILKHIYQQNGTLRHQVALDTNESYSYFTYNTSGTYTGALQFRDGGMFASGTVSANVITQTSDEKEKFEWDENYPDVIESIASVKAGSFTWKKDGSRSIGIGARSLEEVLPEAVHTGTNDSKTVNTGGAAMFLIVQLSRRVVELESKIQQMQR